MDSLNDLFSTHAHAFNQGLAISIGIEPAILFTHITYWLQINAFRNPDDKIDGCYWMYESQKQMSEFLGYLSEDQVSRALKVLIKKGLIIKGNYNRNAFDRTSWYTVYDQKLIEKFDKIKKSLSIPQNCGMDSANLRNGHRKIAESLLTIEEKIQEEQQQGKNVEPPVPETVSPSAAVFSKEEESKQERPKKVTLPSKANSAKPKPSAPDPFYAKPKTVPEPIPEQFELFVPPEQLPERPNSIPKFLADFEIDPDPAIDLTEKRQVLARYTHETIEKAVLFVIANLSKIKTTKIAYLKMACEKGLSVQESKPKLSTLEELKIYFEPYGVYHGATCYINDLGIVFERGMKFGEVKIDKYFSWERVEIMCKSFGIEFTRDLKPKIRDPQ